MSLLDTIFQFLKSISGDFLLFIFGIIVLIVIFRAGGVYWHGDFSVSRFVDKSEKGLRIRAKGGVSKGPNKNDEDVKDDKGDQDDKGDASSES